MESYKLYKYINNTLMKTSQKLKDMGIIKKLREIGLVIGSILGYIAILIGIAMTILILRTFF